MPNQVLYSNSVGVFFPTKFLLGILYYLKYFLFSEVMKKLTKAVESTSIVQ